jgi:hypothetical protein
LELGYGVFEFLRATKQTRDFDNIPSLPNRRDFEDVWNNELRCAMFGVFFQEFSQYCASLRPVLLEETLLVFFNSVRPLPSSAQRAIEGQVTKQIERVGLWLVARRPQLIEIDSSFFQFTDDFCSHDRIGPLPPQISRRWVERSNFFRGIFRKPHHPQLLAIRIQFVDQMGSDLDLAADQRDEFKLKLLIATPG